MKNLVLAILALATPLALAQQPPSCASPTAIALDVASVKPSQSDPRGSHMSGTADSFTASANVFRIIENAYDLHDFQISGGPDWINTTAWDLVAKVDQPPANWANLPSEEHQAIQHQRMQAILAQRFALRCHFEIRALPVYNLVLAKGGSKLKPTPADAANKGTIHGTGRGRENKVDVTGVGLSDIAKHLFSDVGRTVIDKTGLTGLYDFTLTYTSDPDAAAPASADDSVSGPTIFTALEEQLGLKLEPAKGPVPVLVIDTISRPTEN